MASEKKLNRLKFGEKVEALRLLQTGSYVINVMNHFGLAPRTERKLQHNVHGIMKRAEEGTAPVQVNSARPGKISMIEAKVLLFIENARAVKLCVTQDVVQTRTFLHAKSL